MLKLIFVETNVSRICENENLKVVAICKLLHKKWVSCYIWMSWLNLCLSKFITYPSLFR